jgi:DNA-directed RNA polymerase
MAEYLAKSKPPRGLEQVIRRLSPEQLSAMVLRVLFNEIHNDWSKRDRDPPRNPRMMFCLRVGRMLRDELEFAGLFIAKQYVLAKGRPSKAKSPSKAVRDKHVALGKFRRLEWGNAECARAGGWLLGATEQVDLFDLDDRGLPKIADDHKAAINARIEEIVFRHPLYMPSLTPPPSWTSWRTEYDDRIGATFVNTHDPETIKVMKAAFADGTIKPHAAGVSTIQRVPLRINPTTLPLLKQFGGAEYRRDVNIAEALHDRPFWSPVRCDFRGRLVHLSDFNYTRGDPVRSLFTFHEGRPLGDNVHWLAIAVANSFGHKGTWDDKLQWVADHSDYVQAVADDPALVWRGGHKAKEPFQFAAACAEYAAADAQGPDFVTHLPIWLDASSNGLQHLALMCRDSEIAAWVNLIPKASATPAVDAAGITLNIGAVETEAAEIYDAYAIIAEHVALHLTATADSPISQYWLEHRQHLRDLLKSPVMTLPYGASRRTMHQQIREAAADLGLKPTWDGTKQLCNFVLVAIKQKLPGALRVQNHIKGIAAALLEPGREPGSDDKGRPLKQFRSPPAQFISFVTPTGFPWLNRYFESKITRVRLPFLGECVTIAIEDTDQVLFPKARNSAAPSFVHAMDATHLILAANAATTVGITAISTVHDCFATLAPHVQLYAKIRRATLAHMYINNPLDRLREQNTLPGTDGVPPLALGDLDVRAVAHSEYSDR